MDNSFTGLVLNRGTYAFGSSFTVSWNARYPGGGMIRRPFLRFEISDLGIFLG